ncbi:MAG: hypothetical protein V4677_09405 [Bacteroidota bacterium]
MKKLILLLCMATSINTFAGNPNEARLATSKIITETFILTPQPVDPANKPLECCKYTTLGHSWLDGCYTILYECWGQCGNHGWCITACKGGVIIQGAKVVAGNNGPVKVSLPLTTGLINNETFDPNRDPVLQMTQINRIKNAVITIPDDFTVESEDYTLIIKKGDYQILNSELLVIAE